MKLNRKMRRAGCPEPGTYSSKNEPSMVRQVLAVEVTDRDQHGEDESASTKEAYVVRYTIPALGSDEYEVDLDTWKREGWR